MNWQNLNLKCRKSSFVKVCLNFCLKQPKQVVYVIFTRVKFFLLFFQLFRRTDVSFEQLFFPCLLPKDKIFQKLRQFGKKCDTSKVKNGEYWKTGKIQNLSNFLTRDNRNVAAWEFCKFISHGCSFLNLAFFKTVIFIFSLEVNYCSMYSHFDINYWNLVIYVQYYCSEFKVFFPIQCL